MKKTKVSKNSQIYDKNINRSPKVARASQDQSIHPTQLQLAHQNPNATHPQTILQLQRLVGNRAVSRAINENQHKVVQGTPGPERIQRMNFGGYYNPMDDLDLESSSSSESEESPREQFLADAEGWGFNDVTDPEFRKKHVVEGNLYARGEQVARNRSVPISTSVMFTDDDKIKLTEEIKEKTLSLAQGNEPESLQKQKTKDKYLFAEFKKSKKGNPQLKDAGFGRMAYAAQGVPTFGGKQYEVNHLDGMIDVERS